MRGRERAGGDLDMWMDGRRSGVVCVVCHVTCHVSEGYVGFLELPFFWRQWKSPGRGSFTELDHYDGS